MKVAVPTNGENLEDLIVSHFGRARNYLIYDTDTKNFEVFPNPEVVDKEESPPEFLNKMGVNIVICFNLGQKAFEKFEDFRIKIYEALEKNIAENIKDFQNRKLRELKKENIF